MSSSADRGLLTIGAFLIILVVSIVLYMLPLGIGLWMVPPMVIGLFGCWLLVLAGMRSASPQKYEFGPFGTFGWGLLLIATGGAWLLYSVNWLYSIILILLVFGALAIVVALKKK